MRKTVLVVAMVMAWILAGALPAGAAPGAEPSWSGDYSLMRFAASKTGTSAAASQREPDFSNVYTFASGCADGECVASVVAGPPPANESLQNRPIDYIWDGTSWVHTYDWVWDCYRGEGVPKDYNDARSVAYYTPQPDGSFEGVWETTIYGGYCDGTVIMNVAAYPVPVIPALPPMFGSS
ncbi:hypothetical protein ACIGGF_09085 [Rhodococcus sp. NPDC078407]|uniref:hypothetical protein n=1 Tax=Rhodococcus sp. NPDC078407 TaxID=3364509 RepID=UPI0037C593C7